MKYGYKYFLCLAFRITKLSPNFQLVFFLLDGNIKTEENTSENKRSNKDNSSDVKNSSNSNNLLMIASRPSRRTGSIDVIPACLPDSVGKVLSGIVTLDGLEKGQLTQLDDVTRIKLAFRNHGQLAPFVCHLVSKIRNFVIDVT